MRAIFLLSLFFLSLFGRELWLLQQFDPQSIQNNPHLYVYSEKLDGVRAYWDGKHLYTKGDRKLIAPNFFTQNFPPFAIEGELWSKRGDFENIVSIIKSKSNPQKWHELKFYIFEVPNQKGGILERLDFLQAYLNTHPAPFIQIIPQFQVTTLQALKEVLQTIHKEGAEGLVVRNKFAPYYTGRNKDAMKFKPYQDRECKITAYIQGRGKYKNQVGAFECIDEKTKFKIGSGMSDEFRKNPPKIGTIITYKYFGLHKNNKPKFPVFLRIRSDESLNTKEEK
ncbi:DNA ligase [Helicobacter cholecystus]|uniref:DNA ligase n=1 Tax=Helicobacter cholecystus TaxID=45498 RepID=A0A3D8IWB7_9HELI|nr:DNA ligase [Helicobacter cholecystus]RDU69577.1 DNA ligase [Helicobacter cholecystus]VEJ24134.1 DNA ligase [Helicobacter cholecystus]